MRNKHFSKSLMVGVVASALLVSPVSVQAGNWAGVVIPVGGLALTLATAGTVATMTGINTDAAQIAAEALVYAAMVTVTDTWEPEPKDSYEKAAEANDDGSSVNLEDTTVGSIEEINFALQSLVAKGIEAVPVAAEPETLAEASARNSTLQALTLLKGSDPNLTFNNEFTSTQERTVVSNQQKNEQWIATEGIARAELALLTAQQGAADDGASLADAATSLDTEEKKDIQVTSVKGAAKQSTLSGLVDSSQVTSIAKAMRIQSVMNLELAQRMNLSNMLQGNILSAESARLLQTSNPN